MRQNAGTQMRAPLWTLFAVMAAISGIAACSGEKGPPPGHADSAPTVTIPPDVKLLAAPSGEPEELPGVNTTELSSRERRAYWSWVSQLYAPCPNVAVSVAECVAQERPCASCVAAAEFLAQRARMGASQNEAIAAYVVRFSKDVKKVDLADSPVMGPPGAPVTIIVWSDFECPACGYAVPFLDEVLSKYSNDVRLVHKLYPLKSHSHSHAAAHAAIAAKRQGKYWEMEKALFSHQKHLEDKDLEVYARNIGLDMQRFGRDINDPKCEDIIERDRAEAEKHGLSGTPFILINGREFDLGFFKLDRDLDSWISADIAIAKREAALGVAAAMNANLPGGGVGPTSPLSTGVPAASAAPATSAVPAASAAPSSNPSRAPVPPSKPLAVPSSAPPSPPAPTAKPTAAPR
jgi:protein-disulfide isomerase